MAIYSKEKERDILQKTEDLIESGSGIKEGADLEKTAEILREVLRYHEWRYYIRNEPAISDEEFDQIFKMLEKLEVENPELISNDSPTQRVASDESSDFSTVDHLLPMLSLANSYNFEDLSNFSDQVRRKLKEEGDFEIHYSVEPKYDGSSIALIYENDQLIRAATRGNGIQGDDITQNVRTLKTVPLNVPFSRFGIQKAELRGEALISLDIFNRINKQREKEDQNVFANPRNAAAGGLRMKNPAEASRRGIEMIVYQIGYAVDGNGQNKLADFKSHSRILELLHDLGFKSSFPDHRVFYTIEDVFPYLEEWELKRSDYPYEIDGMVVKVNELDLQEKAGSTSHHPRWAIAYKFKARQATSRLLKVEYQVGKIGTITPVAKIQPVSLAGAVISSVSLHNEEFIRSKDIRIGDRLMVERAGDVIPYIVKSLPEFRSGDEEEIRFPEYCPVNDTYQKVPLKKVEDEAAWRCPDCVCGQQPLKRIIFFVSKDAMDIDGLGKSLVERFFREGMVQRLPDIYDLDYERISQLEGFGAKSAANLERSVEISKNRPLKRLLFALGIHHLGKRGSAIIANEVENVFELKEWREEDYLALKDIGPVLARNMVSFFNDSQNLELLEELKNKGVNTHRTEEDRSAEVKGGPLSGLKILFTGSLQQMTRKEAQKLAEEAGAQNISAVSSNLDILVVGEKAGSKLKKAEKIESVKIWTEEEFYQKVNRL